MKAIAINAINSCSLPIAESITIAMESVAIHTEPNHRVRSTVYGIRNTEPHSNLGIRYGIWNTELKVQHPKYRIRNAEYGTALKVRHQIRSEYGIRNMDLLSKAQRALPGVPFVLLRAYSFCGLLFTSTCNSHFSTPPPSDLSLLAVPTADRTCHSVPRVAPCRCP